MRGKRRERNLHTAASAGECVDTGAEPDAGVQAMRGRSGAGLLFGLLLALPACPPSGAVPAASADAEFRTTCWECRKGIYAKRRFSVRQCRSGRESCPRGQGHTACDWTDDPREHLGGGEARGETNRLRWEAQLAELERFKALHGHCHVPQRGQEGDSAGMCWARLARWTNKQQLMRREQRLPPERAARLQQLGFDFDYNSFVAAWEQHFVELLHYKQNMGHCNVPTWRPTPELSASFVAWVDRQRRNFKSSGMLETPKRRSRLDSLGFVWDVKQSWWEDNLASLVAHCRSNGQVLNDSTILSVDATTLPAHLKTWLYEQRASFARGSLASQRLRMIDASGIDWRAPNRTEAFNSRVDVLVSYRNTYGHCFVPKHFRTTNPKGQLVRLGEWCAEQRKKHRKAMLKPSRLLQLANLGFPLCGLDRHNMRHSRSQPQPRKQPAMLLLLHPPRQNEGIQGPSCHRKRNRRHQATAHGLQTQATVSCASSPRRKLRADVLEVDASNMSPCLAVCTDLGADCTGASRLRLDQVEPSPLSLSPGHGVDGSLIWTSWKGPTVTVKGLYTGKMGDTRVPLWVDTRGSRAEESLGFDLLHTSKMIESFAVPPSA